MGTLITLSHTSLSRERGEIENVVESGRAHLSKALLAGDYRCRGDHKLEPSCERALRIEEPDGSDLSVGHATQEVDKHFLDAIDRRGLEELVLFPWRGLLLKTRQERERPLNLLESTMFEHTLDQADGNGSHRAENVVDVLYLLRTFGFFFHQLQFLHTNKTA